MNEPDSDKLERVGAMVLERMRQRELSTLSTSIDLALDILNSSSFLVLGDPEFLRKKEKICKDLQTISEELHAMSASCLNNHINQQK